jgi:hypothetical protein
MHVLEDYESYPRKPSQYFNPQAFLTPATGTFGNVSRDVLTGPGLFGLDFSAAKSAHLSERLGLQFRAEFFNILNHIAADSVRSQVAVLDQY